MLPLVDSTYQLPAQDQLVPAAQTWASVPQQPDRTYLKVIESEMNQEFLSSRTHWFSKILSLLTPDVNSPDLGIDRANGVYKYLKNYHTDPLSDGLCYTFDPNLLSHDVAVMVPYIPQALNLAELSPVYFIFPGSHTTTMFEDAITLANPMDTTTYAAQPALNSVATQVLQYIQTNQAFLDGRDVFFVGFSLGGLRAIYTHYALELANSSIAQRTQCIAFNPWVGKFSDGDLLGLAALLGVNYTDDRLDPWHLARLVELRSVQTGLPIQSVIERTLVHCIRGEQASRLWQTENNANPPQPIGWGRLYMYDDIQQATDPSVAHSIINWAGNSFPDTVPDIHVVKHGTYALSSATMFLGKTGVHAPTMLTVTTVAQQGYHHSMSQFAVHSFWRAPGVQTNQYLWNIVPVNSVGLLKFSNKYDPTLEFFAQIAFVGEDSGQEYFTLKTQDGTWISTGAPVDYSAQELDDFAEGNHQYLSLIFALPPTSDLLSLRNGGYLWTFHSESQVLHDPDSVMQIDQRRTWSIPTKSELTYQLFQQTMPSATGTYEVQVYSYKSPTFYVQQRALTATTIGDYKHFLAIVETDVDLTDTYPLDTWKFVWDATSKLFCIKTYDAVEAQDIYLGRLKQTDGEYLAPTTTPANWYQDNSIAYSDDFEVETTSSSTGETIFKISQSGSSLKAIDGPWPTIIKSMIFDASPPVDTVIGQEEFFFVLKASNGTDIVWPQLD